MLSAERRVGDLDRLIGDVVDSGCYDAAGVLFFWGISTILVGPLPENISHTENNFLFIAIMVSRGV